MLGENNLKSRNARIRYRCVHADEIWGLIEDGCPVCVCDRNFEEVTKLDIMEVRDVRDFITKLREDEISHTNRYNVFSWFEYSDSSREEHV